MNQRTFLRLLCTPSAFSAVSCVAVALALLSASSWSYLFYNQPLYDRIFGAQGLSATLQSIDDIRSSSGILFSGPLVYNLIIILQAAVLGIAVYFGLILIHLAYSSAKTTFITLIKSDPAAKKALELELWEHILLRLTVFVAWCFYLLVFVKIVIPFAGLTVQAMLEGLSWQSLSYAFGGFVILVIALHIQVMLVRLLMLRPRLFG